jgi:hypothetical protein
MFLGKAENKLYGPLNKYIEKYNNKVVNYFNLGIAVLKFLGEI